MFAVTNDGAHLVVQDGFGLSRFTFSKGLKTDRALSGHDLTVAGNRLLVQSARTGKRALRTVDALLNEKFGPGDYGQYALHPDGVHVVDWSSDVAVYETEGKLVQTHRWPAELRSLGKLELGAERPPSAGALGIAVIGPDATLAAYRSHTRSLAVARLVTAKKFEPLYRVEVEAPVGQLVLYPFAERTYFGAHDRRTRLATLYSLTPDAIEHSWKLDALSAPMLGGGYWFWQRDEKTVCRADWRELDKPERFEIPKEFRGRGQAIGHGDRVLFLPFDAERLVDLRTRKTLERKLGAKDAAVRTLATETARVFDAWLAEEGGALGFGHVDQPKSLAAPVWSPTFDLGASTLSATMAYGELIARCSAHDKSSELMVMSYSHPQGLARVTLADVRRAFDACERNKGLLLRALCGLEHTLKSAFAPAYRVEDRRPAERHEAFDEDAATAVLRAVDETVRARRVIPLADNVEGWASKRWTPQSLAELSFPDDAWKGPKALMGAFHLPMVVGFIALDLFGKDALPALSRWFVEAPAPFSRANPHIAGDVCARLVQRHPETEQPFRATCEASGAHGQEMLSSLDFTLARGR
jgi:hypothetical protein